ncbi:MAG: LapD/MoxY N-terminal periplasmic domain-containing protein [Campylobacterota bacterium]|nr:LapD/MoxY N-terminal periplasmic domain-containing protein [Campylobacterota bacterium]
MTLFKQIAILTSLFLSIILITVLFLNFKSANAQMQEQLYNDAKNTATSLSLTLGTAMGDATVMDTMINANFDSGHYMQITLLDIEDNILYDRIAEEKNPDVPEWFVNAVPINIPIASAQVSSGWSPIGILHVQSDNTHAYVQLYDTLINLLIWFSIIASISLGSLSMILHLFLRPLTKVRQQAEAISNNKFIIQKELPYTLEFRDVVNAMNIMVKKVQDIFDKGNEALQRNQELLYNDPLTKLYNRRYLMLKLPNILNIDNANNGGSTLFIALNDAQLINQQIGHQKADKFFCSLSSKLLQMSEPFEDAIVTRMNGTEFAIVLPDCERDSALHIATEFRVVIDILKKEYLLKSEIDIISIGIYRYSNNQKIPEILTKSDYALTQAKAREGDHLYAYEQIDDTGAMGKEQWRHILEEAMTFNHFKTIFWPVVNTKTHQEVQRVLTFAISDNNAKNYSYGSFIAPAISLGLIQKIYMYILEKLFKSPPQKRNSTLYSIRLSSEFLKAPHSYDDLQKLFKLYSTEFSSMIAFEISDTIVLKNLEVVKSFDTLFDRFGYKIGINEFTGESKDYAYLRDIRPQFIKADASFFLDQSSESMSALQVLTDSLGIELIATGVKEEEVLKELKVLKITTIQGPLAEQLLS